MENNKKFNILYIIFKYIYLNQNTALAKDPTIHDNMSTAQNSTLLKMMNSYL